MVTSLQYGLRAAQQQLASFKSGQKYVNMKRNMKRMSLSGETDKNLCRKNCTDSVWNNALPVSNGLKAQMTCRQSTKRRYVPFRQRMPVSMSEASRRKRSEMMHMIR